MNETIKFIFLMLMGAIIAALLYWIFFGTVTLSSTDASGTYHAGEETAGEDASGFYFKSHWDGALMYASRAIETPISAYYYYYCYLPTAYNNLYMDAELCSDDNGQVSFLDAGNFLDLTKLGSDLSTDTTDVYDMKQSSRYRYSTGFH